MALHSLVTLRHEDATPAILAPLEHGPVRYELAAGAGGFTTTVLEPPISQAVSIECSNVWQQAFGVPFEAGGGAQMEELQDGSVRDHLRQVLYLARVDGVLAGTTMVTQGRGPGAKFGGLGNVATLPAYRGRGIAAMLVALSRDDFARLGGHLLALGTVMPNAARIYRAAGYCRLGGCDAWYCNVLDYRSPEEYLVDHFRAARASATPPRYVSSTGAAVPVQISEGSARDRVSMMGLLHFNGLSIAACCPDPASHAMLQQQFH